MIINNKKFIDFSAIGLLESGADGVPISSTVFQPKNRMEFILAEQSLSLKKYTLKVIFTGTNIKKNKSMFDREMLGKIELSDVDDGAVYYGYCENLGGEDWQSRNICKSEYGLVCCIRKSKEIVIGNNIYCSSNVPKTGCTLSATVGISAARYRLWNAYFLNVSAGDKIVFDGINCRILINGSPRATKCEWVDFPYLVPGLNNIICADPVTVEYYPTFL